MKKKKSLKREVIEWVIFFGIIGTLYITGLHTPVLGFLQGLILKTGIIQPKINEDNSKTANYNFSLADVDGNKIDFEEFKGKVVFMNLWATWCPPCIAEMPDINTLYKEINNDDIKFVMIALDEDFEKAKNFVRKKGFDFPIYKLTTAFPQVYESGAIPTTFVISPNGQIVVSKQGMAKYSTQEFKNHLLELVKEQNGK